GGARFSGVEDGKHVEENAAVLLYHAKQADITRCFGQLARLRVQLFAFGKIAAALRNDSQAVEAVRLALDRSALFRVNQALGITAIGGLGFTLLAMERPLPPEGVGQTIFEGAGLVRRV